MKTIVITGCSWGAGEWSGLGNLTHAGLAEYFKEDGFNVVNLSQPGTGPWSLLDSLRYFIWVNKDLLNIQHVFFLQSDISRDFSKFHNKIIWNSTLNLEHNVKGIYRQLYHNLNNIGVDSDIHISLIGGVTDLVMEFKNDFKYLKFLIPSWTQLIDPTAIPVLMFKFDDIPDDFKNNKEEISQFMDQVLTRFNVFENNKKHFWPDGGHPNRLGHRVLYDAIKPKLNL